DDGVAQPQRRAAPHGCRVPRGRRVRDHRAGSAAVAGQRREPAPADRRPGAAAAEMSEVPTFSVVIPTYLRRASLERVLAALATREGPRDALEVLVVSDGGDDGSVELARSFALPFALRVLEQANRGPAA